MDDADRHDQIESLARLKELLDQVDDHPNIDESDVRDAATRAVNLFDAPAQAPNGRQDRAGGDHNHSKRARESDRVDG